MSAVWALGTIAAALALLLALALAPALAQAQSTCQDYLRTAENIALRAGRLSEVGMDVSGVIDRLNGALALINSTSCASLGDQERAWVEGNLSLALAELSSLEAQEGSFVFARNLALGLEIAGAIALPLLVYIFLPRLWAYAWYLAHRRWIVREARRK
ncbi:MAG: hypothetical protein ABWK00_02055 [Desulfurococcaceae archaeon]